MTDLTPNDLSHLSDEEFNALCPQGYHAPGPAEPLSAAAQAILHEFWGAPVSPARNVQIAAALRAAADQVVPHENDLPSLPPMHEMIEDPIYSLAADAEHEQRQRTRAQLLAIAAELEGKQ